MNLLLKLSLSQSILISTFTSWIQCLWGGVPCCQHIPASVSGSSASLVAACWEKLLSLRSWWSVSSLPLPLVSFRTPCSWDILRGRSIATRDTRSDEYWSADEISSESRENRCFWKSSPQQKPDALHTSASWQLKCFEYRQKSAQGKFFTPTVPISCVAKSSDISAGPYIKDEDLINKPRNFSSNFQNALWPVAWGPAILVNIYKNTWFILQVAFVCQFFFPRTLQVLK